MFYGPGILNVSRLIHTDYKLHLLHLLAADTINSNSDIVLSNFKKKKKKKGKEHAILCWK